MPKKPSKFAIFAGKYLSEALKKAARAYRPGKRPRPSIIKNLQAKRDELNKRIKQEKHRGR